MDKLNTQERRKLIIQALEASKEPVSGSELARRFGVSRQVIVTDIAILRSQNPSLIATARGYMIMTSSMCSRVFKVLHTDEETYDELTGIVDLGGQVVDIYVDHRIYGTIRRPLDICSKRDVERFFADMEAGVSTPLKNITNGYHFHTVEARSEEILDEIEEMLREKGYLIEANDAPVTYEPKSYSGG